MVHDELRYIEYTLTDQKREYRLGAVAASDTLTSVMHYSQTGVRLPDIVRHLVQTPTK